jgi:MFS family permease
MILGFTMNSLPIFYAIILPTQALASAALGAAAATTQDLVLPRMRGTATGTFFIGTTLIGLALGPYLAGYVSTVTGDLATGMLSLLVTVPVALVAAIAAYRLLPAAEASRAERARAAGEVI